MSKKGLLRGARAVVGVSLLAFVVLRLDTRSILNVFREVDIGFLAAACAFQILAKIVWATRWQDILRALGLVRRFRDLLALVFVGLFFNNFLPTSAGGDLVRGYYTSHGKEQGERKVALSYAAVLIERSLGLIALAATVVLAALATLVMRIDIPKQLLVLAIAAGTAGTILGCAVFIRRDWRDRLATRFGGRVAEAAGAMNLFFRPETRRMRIVVASFVLQIIGILFYASCAFAVGVDVPWLVMFLVVPVSVVASMLPVSLNGLGVREGVFIALLSGFGVASDRAAAFALLALAVATAFALLGGLLYPFYKVSSPTTGPVEEVGRETRVDPIL